jgi:hypothetical protein
MEMEGEEGEGVVGVFRKKVRPVNAGGLRFDF